MLTRLIFAAALWLFASPLLAQDWGDAPPPQQPAEEKALALLQRNLKDPYSAHVRWEPMVGTTRIVDAATQERYLGWLLVGYVNAKNSYGAYVGEKPYAFLVMGDELVAGFQDTPEGYWKLIE
jgi:hypothetical protein